MNVHDCFCFCGFILMIFLIPASLVIMSNKEEENNEDNDKH